MQMDETIQAILGSYNTSIGVNINEASSLALQEAATQSNASGMPYIVNFLASLTQAYNIILDLIPKYNKNIKNKGEIRRKTNKIDIIYLRCICI